MVVTCTWADSGGTALADPYDHGNIGNGSGADALDIYIYHDGSEAITNCGLYIQAYSGTSYGGGATPASDYTEILEWGSGRVASEHDASTAGGFWINANAAGTFPATDWAAHEAATGVAGTEFDVPTSAGVATENEIASGETATIRVKIRVPEAEDTAGTRFFDQCLKYTYTS
jgi:hypothetical protein